MVSVSSLEQMDFQQLLCEVGDVQLWATFVPNVVTVYRVRELGKIVHIGENIHKAVAKFNEIAGPFEEHL